jgi:hypothetical protein
MQWSVVRWRSASQSAAQPRASPSQKFIVHVGMYGKVCLRHGRRLHRASARHNESVFRFENRDGLDDRGDSKIHHGKNYGDRRQSRDGGWVSQGPGIADRFT